MRIISIDLDNTLFNIQPLYKSAFPAGAHYTNPTSWDLYKCYPPEIADKIVENFKSQAIYHTSLLNESYPYLLHNMRNHHQLRFITTRKSYKKPMPYGDGYVPYAHYETYRQLLANGVRCALREVILTEDETKLEAIKAAHVDLVVDDSPIVIESCLANNIDNVLISTQNTPYNHYLREKTTWAKDLYGAFAAKKM